MRKILLPFALLGALSINVVACDVQDDGDATDATDATNPGDTTPPGDTENPGDTTPTDQYFAVIVDDSQIFPHSRSDSASPCATSSVGAHGADIDAIGLFDGSSLIGYLDTVDYEPGTLCTIAAKYSDPSEAKGAPDGTLLEGFVSLGGGYLTGEFQTQPAIESGDTIIVYEVGKKACDSGGNCGQDEGYEVFIASDLDCVNQGGYPYSACADELSNSAKGETSIPVTGF